RVSEYPIQDDHTFHLCQCREKKGEKPASAGVTPFKNKGRSMKKADIVDIGCGGGYNIKSQLLKLFVIFPALSALAAWICTLV
ncbi:MAG: hypothetical protein IJI10_12550, partial [Eubacterium sp.]|nr:hypothetical protein [Eubacterium sp.]